MAEETEKKESGGGKGLLIVLIVLVVLLLVAVGGIGYYLYSTQQDDPNKPKEETNVKKEATEEEKKQSFTAKVENMVVNVTTAKGRIKLMKLSLALTSFEPTIEQIVADNEAEIKDSVIRAVSARNAEELLTVAGKELLKEELLNDINEILNEATMANPNIKKNMIKKVYFTAFVMR